MKKYLVVLLSVLAIVAFATSSFALHEVKDMFEYTPQVVKSSKAMITLGGEIRIRGEISNNNTDLRDSDDSVGAVGGCTAANSCDDKESVYNQRVRLNLKATVSPNTLGFVELESGSDNTDTWDWGTDTEGASGIYEKSNSKRGALFIRQAYIAHQGNGLLGIPAGFKAGHMLLALGNGMFYDHTKFGDDALLFWVAPMDGMEVALVAIKVREQGTVDADDTDAYAVTFTGAFGPVNVGADVTYLQDNNFGSGLTAGDTEGNAALWNIGLRADADAGPVNIYGDLEIQTGEVDDYKTDASEVDLGGWALMVGAKAKINDMISVGGEFAYGSGDDIDTDDEYEGFINSIGSGQHYTYLYDQHVPTAGQSAPSTVVGTSSTYTGSTNEGLANTWYLNVGADVKATPDLKIAADLYYLAASEKVANDSSTANAETSEDKDIGVEIDATITYQLDTNIVYYVEAGYLFAGDFYTNVTRDSGNIDNPWSVRNGLLLSF